MKVYNCPVWKCKLDLNTCISRKKIKKRDVRYARALVDDCQECLGPIDSKGKTVNIKDLAGVNK
jgi:hypothetical protein